MGVFFKHKGVEFGVGDRIKISQKIREKDKTRTQVFEGLLIAVRGSAESKSITVRRIGSQKIGIERIYFLSSPAIEKIVLVKKGSLGVKKAKLYYVRKKSRKEIDKIYSRFSRRKESK